MHGSTPPCPRGPPGGPHDATAAASLGASRTKRRFTEAEDRAIIEMFEGMGIQEWTVIACKIGRRTARQCRERWRHYLRPVIAGTPWSAEEDELLRQEFTRYGPRWAQISALFPGRTEVNLKNRWSKLTRETTRSAKEQREVAAPSGLRHLFPPIQSLIRSIEVGAEVLDSRTRGEDQIFS
jgi:hypothetical protein